jgi:spore maturation protein CgeB
MQILVVGRKYTESFAMHISETLTMMGHNVVVFEPGVKTGQAKTPLHHTIIQVRTQLLHLFQQTKIGQKRENKRLFETTKNTDIDLVISCHDFLTPKQVKLLKEYHKCKVVMWFPDHISGFGKSMFLNADYDALFFKEPLIVEVLTRELGINAFYLPECCNPYRHVNIEINEEDKRKYGCDISTAGNMHTARAAFFKQIKEYDIKIWGNPAPNWMDVEEINHMIQNHFVSNEEKSRAFKASKIVLNNLYPSEIEGVNVRLFEVAATGSFQICSYRKSIDNLYVNDEEIVTFKTISELKDKIDFYLVNEERRKFIALNAYKRTIAEHTYEKRLMQIFNFLKL